MTRLHRRQRPYLWIGLILILVECALQLAGLWTGNPDRIRMLMVEFAGFWPGLMGDWQSNYIAQPITMFVSYWLLHSGPGHLFGNLVIMIWFAYRIGPDLRRTETWEIWFASVLGGAVAFGLLTSEISPMIGASGGTFGLLGAFVVIDFIQTDGQDGRREAIRRTGLICTIIVVLSIFDFALRDAILAWQAHLGGFVTGVALTVAISPRGRPHTR